MENENTEKKLVVTSISHNNKVTTDKHAVWERKHFTLLTLHGVERRFTTLLLLTPSMTDSETWTLTKRDRKQLNIFEMKVYKRILGPVYDNEKENWRILTNKEIYTSVNKPTLIETIRLNRLC